MVKKNKLPTLEELNKTQQRWMALSPSAPEKDKKEVFAAMKRAPVAHLSVNPSQTTAVAMVHSTPQTASPIPLHDAIELMNRIATHLHPDNIRLDVYWEGANGRWVEAGKPTASYPSECEKCGSIDLTFTRVTNHLSWDSVKCENCGQARNNPAPEPAKVGESGCFGYRNPPEDCQGD